MKKATSTLAAKKSAAKKVAEKQVAEKQVAEGQNYNMLLFLVLCCSVPPEMCPL